MNQTLLSSFGTAFERVEHALDALREGRGVMVLDDEDRENEGDMIFAAETMTVEQMALTIRHGSGIVCLCLTEERRKQLDLPMMVENNTSAYGTGFTVTIEAAEGVTTGVSAADRVTTVRAAIADDVDANCGGLLNYPFRSGEFLAGLPEGRPLFARSPEANMTLGNFMRAQLFSAFSPVKIGMDVMTKQERVQVDSLVGHGGIFATPKVAQKILAAAFNTPIKVMSTAAEGGAWGMAVLANYLWNTNEDHSNLADFLDGCVFKDAQSTTEKPVASDVVGFEDFFARFTKGLPIEHAAIETINLEDK
jgi:sugar (pentulose or hexulose) kinase